MFDLFSRRTRRQEALIASLNAENQALHSAHQTDTARIADLETQLADAKTSRPRPDRTPKRPAYHGAQLDEFTDRMTALLAESDQLRNHTA